MIYWKSTVVMQCGYNTFRLFTNIRADHVLLLLLEQLLPLLIEFSLILLVLRSGWLRILIEILDELDILLLTLLMRLETGEHTTSCHFASIQLKEYMTQSKPTLLTHPFTTLYYFGIVVLHFLRDTLKWLLGIWYVVLLVVLVTVAPRFVDGSHKQVPPLHIT